MGRNMTWISTRAAAQRRPTSGNSRWRRGHRRGPDSARTRRSAIRTHQPTRRSPPCARRKGVLPACASPMAAFAHVARRAEHTPAAHDVFFVPLRGGRGGQLGENWARPQARGPSGKRKGPGRFGRADGRSKTGTRVAIADANGAPTKHRAGAMISTQPVANAGWASLT